MAAARRRAMRGMIEGFKRADADASGAVDHDELEAVLVERFTGSGWMSLKSPAEIRQLTGNLLISFDADESGELELAEFIRLTKHLFRMEDARELLVAMQRRFDSRVDAATLEASARLGSSGAKRRAPASARKQPVAELLVDASDASDAGGDASDAVAADAASSFNALRRARRRDARASANRHAAGGGDDGEVGSATCTKVELAALQLFVESGRLASCSEEAGAPLKRSAGDVVVELRAALSEARGVKLYLSGQLAAAEGQVVAKDEQLALRCAALDAVRAANDSQAGALKKIVREWEARASTFKTRLAQKEAALEELQTEMARQLTKAEEERRQVTADGGTWRAALTKQLALRDAERATAVAERDEARASAESLTLALRAAEIAATVRDLKTTVTFRANPSHHLTRTSPEHLFCRSSTGSGDRRAGQRGG